MGKLNKAVRLLWVTILVFSMVVTCCGCKNTDTDGNGKDVVVSPVVEPSKEETKETAETVETEKPAETVEPVATEEPAEPEKPVELTGDYLKEMAQEEVWEFKLSDYNADFVAGNLVTITMVIESAGEFNGTLGTCIGTAYAWEQTEFSSQAGEYTVEWKIQPSVDMAQLGLWYAESGSVGVKSVDVAIEEVEVALEGDYIKVLQMGDNWEMKLSDYNSEYKVGDYVNIEITMESDGDFNGAVGACVGKDYAWQQKEYKYDTAGTYTFSWKVKPSTDMAQIGVWWTGGTGVGITKVKVTKEEQPIGISGDFIELFTEQGYYEFSPYAVSDYIFKFGDTIKVTVELESDGAFNGCMATCVGDNYAWEQTEMSGESGTTTWTMTVAPTADLIQIAVWWIDGTAVGIKDIKIDMVKWGYQHKNVVGDIYTSTSTDDDYTFKPSDYCDFNDGDIITIEVGMDSNDIYNGCVRMTDVNGVSRTANFESRGTAIPTLVLQANKDTEATIDFWWMNTKVAVNTIKVYKGGELPKIEPGVFEYASTQLFPLSDYVDYEAGDTLKITATLSSDGEFNGALAASSLDAANGYWDQEGFESKDGSAVTCTFILEQAQITDLNVMVWWVAGSKVVVDPKAITVEVIESGSDSGSGEGGSEDDSTEGDEETTAPEVTGTLIFYGDANESYESNDVSWLMDAADNDVITLVYKGSSTTAGWGVLGWGAGVDGNWIDSNTVTSLGYSSDATDGTKELTVTMTAGELKDAFGITDESTVTAIKLGAWNGGQIVSLSIASEDEAGDTEGGENEGDGTEGDGTEGDEEATAPEVDGTLIFYGDANESYESNDVSWLMDASDDDVITLVYKGESGKNNWGVLGWGAGVDGNWIDSNTVPSLGYSSDATDGSNELTVTMTAGELKDAFGITDESTVTAIKLGAWNGGQIISLSIKGENETGDTEGGETEGDGTDTDDTPTYPVWGDNSVTYLSNTGYWSEQVITLSQLLGDVEAANVESITFNSDVNIAVGYKNTDGSGVISETNNDVYWSQVDNAKSHTLSNISFGDNFYMKLVLRDSSEEAHTITWTIAEKEEVTYPVWGDNSVTYLSNTGYWSEQVITLSQLLGDVEAANVESITFNSDVNIAVGYKNTDGSGVISETNNDVYWSQVDNAKSHTLSNISFGDNFYMKLVLRDSSEEAHTITWTIAEKEEVAYPVWGDNSVTYVGTSGWSEQAITLEQLLGDVDVDMVEKVIISCETANIGAGYSNNTGENNWWSQVSDSKSHELTDINFSNFTMKLVLQATDSQAHKITWEVVEKEIPTVITLFEGNKAATDSGWADYLQIDSTKFAGVKTDGTQKLVITYNSVDTGNWGTQMQVCDGNWNSIKTLNLCVSDEITIEWTLTSEFANLLTTGMIVQGWNWNISKIEVMPIEQSNYNCTEAWNGSVTLDGWDKSLSISKDYFADLSFDGTERVIVTYVSIESSDGAYTLLQYLYDDNGWVIMDGVGYGVLCSSTEQRATVTLDSTYADNIKAGGFIIQGHNCTITKVEIVKPNS